MFFKAATAFTLVSTVSAAVITVTVGDGGLVFKPNNITAQNGDIVNFQFTGAPGNHTVSQAAFAAPCAQLPGGFDSGYVPVPAGFKGAPAEWNLTISDASKPIWFYCKQKLTGPHCIGGMVGAINAPGTGNTIEAFTAASKALSALPDQSPGSLTGVGAAASASPSPLASSSSSGSSSAAGGSSTAPAPSASAGGGGGSGYGNSASSVTSNGLWALFAGVMGIAMV